MNGEKETMSSQTRNMVMAFWRHLKRRYLSSMRPIVYIDPQSYKNLSIYDYGLLSNMEGDIYYLCSTNYDYLPLPPHIKQHKIFNYNNKKGNIAKAVSYMCSYVRIFFLVLRWRPQAIHLQWMRIPDFDVAFLKTVKLLTGCKLVFTAHNVLPHNERKKYIASYGRMYKLADAIIVHTHATKRELISIFSHIEEKVSVIAHGLLKLNYDSTLLKQKESQFESYYQLDGKFVFSALGFQYHYKGVDLLAEVWASTPELCNSKHCKLLFVGKNKGVDLSAVNGIENVIIEDRVIPDEEFFYLLTHTDVYLLPYREISQSGVLLTTISVGTPFLVTDVGGLAESLDIAQVGWKMDKLSVEELRKQLLWLLHHPEQVAAAKNNTEGWSLLRKHYDWQKIGQLTQKLYT